MKASSIALTAILCVAGATSALADNTAQSLPYTQLWTNTGMITTDNVWSGVPGVMGYRGDDLTTATGADPQTLLADGTSTPVNVFANKTDPAAFFSGGIAEFELPNPTVALSGTGVADAPFLLFNLNTVANALVRAQYDLRDIEGGSDNAIQRVALHYRVGNTGSWTNVPTAYVADATSGPNQSSLISHVDVTLPSACNNQPLVQIRMMTTNAVGNDEWVGVDNICVTGNATTPVAPSTWGTIKKLYR